MTTRRPHHRDAAPLRRCFFPLFVLSCSRCLLESCSFVVPPPRLTTGSFVSNVWRSRKAEGTCSRGASSSSSSSSSPSSSTRLFLAKKASAKKKKRTKKGGGGGGGGSKKGGFGAPPPSAEKKAAESGDDEDQDYSVFPALEEHVQETLIPVHPDDGDGSGGVMSGEIYDRLAQIYGFGRFNYEEADEAEEDDGGDDDGASADEEVSFDDLIGGGSSSSSSSAASSSSSSSHPSLNFGDLLGSSGSGGGGAGAAKPAFGVGSGGGGDDLSDLIASATGGGGGGASSPAAPAPPPPPVVAKDLALSSLPPFPNVRVLHVDPCVLAVDDFFTPDECDAYIALSSSPPSSGGGKGGEAGDEGGESALETRSKTVGKDSRAKAQRTSTTWFHRFRAVPELVAKASRLLGLDGIERWEEPQTVRYRKSEKFTWHLDALAPSDDLGAKGGQRVATLLVYLTDLSEKEGGATMFRDLTGPDGKSPLKMRPKKGSALLFFPAAGGIPHVPFDVRTLHAGEAVSVSVSDDGDESPAEKWIAQMWLRESAGYVPTAPPGNVHADAADAVRAYCSSASAGEAAAAATAA